jgi:hypothetical protein
MSQGQPSILIVDEAQRLPEALLEEVRLLLNLETGQTKLLEIILVGQPELSQILARSDFRQLKQRVSYTCRLKPLGLEELREYVNHRLNRAGLPDQTLFPDHTIEVLHRYSGGIPRLVNTLCDNALRTGFAMQSPQIDVSILDEVATELELSPNGLPLPSAAAARSPERVPSQTPPEAPRSQTVSSNGRVLQEEHASRQESMGLFANLVRRWE